MTSRSSFAAVVVMAAAAALDGEGEAGVAGVAGSAGDDTSLWSRLSSSSLGAESASPESS